MHRIRLSLALLVALCCVNNGLANSSGLWGVPGTLGQFFGHGFGAGHHAPMVRAAGHHPPHVRRLVLDQTPRQFASSAHHCSGSHCNVGDVYHSASGCTNGHCVGQADTMQYQHHATQYIPQQYVPQQHYPSPTPTLSAPQPVFSTPDKPKTNWQAKPTQQQPAQPKQPDRSSQPQRTRDKQRAPQPAKPTRPAFEEKLPSPPMPTTDPTVELQSEQALYSW